mmetsp:Transcript_23304/g.50961  ORF Transcript_23304/g.50961 Transcript_23304/m.50961 type:complete len:612 (+) Transcript_23304:225-2060(+)
MKNTLVIIGIFLATVQAAEITASSSSFRSSSSKNNNNSNNNNNGKRHLLESGFECTLYIKAIEYEDGHGEQTLTCELPPRTMAALAAADGSGNSTDIPMGVSEIVEIVGVGEESMKQMGAISGASIMRLSEGYIEQDGDLRLVVPSKANFDIESISEDDGRHFRNRHRSRQLSRKLAKSTGRLKTLVLRVIDREGAEPDLSIDQLRSKIFTDKVSLKTQYKACSNSRVKIQERGVVNVFINKVAQTRTRIYNGMEVVDGNNAVLEQAAREQAVYKYAAGGSLSDKFDIVMYCLPAGSGDWIAYAYINGRDSVYNNKWCGMVSTQMHEVGHNLGLGHSGDSENQYGDQSSMMGYSYFIDNGPAMCFNAAKNFQLNWYRNQDTTYNPLDGLDNPKPLAKFVLNGVSDAVRGRTKKLISLRLKVDDKADYYVGYNLASGINRGSVEARNQIVIFRKQAGGPRHYGKSIRVAELSSNEEYTVENWNKSTHDVTIRVVGDIGGNVKDAKIEIFVRGYIPIVVPTTAPTKPPWRPDGCSNTRIKFLVNGNLRGCLWLKRIKKQTKRKCEMKDDGGKQVSDLCPQTCAEAGLTTCWSVEAYAAVKRKKREILRKEIFG